MKTLKLDYSKRMNTNKEVKNQFKDSKKQGTAERLLTIIPAIISYGDVSLQHHPKVLKKTIFKQSLNDPLVLQEYTRFKSSLGLFSLFAWPIFKMILKWVVLFVIDNYVEEE